MLIFAWDNYLWEFTYDDLDVFIKRLLSGLTHLKYNKVAWNMKNKSIRTFLRCMMPLIYVGYLPLLGSYLTTMYFVVALDGNHESLLLAVGLRTLECEEYWQWFMMKLKECLGDDTEVGFISNLCDKIGFAVERVYPDSYHGYCPKDIARKIRDFVGHNDTEVKTLFWKSCNTYSVHDFYLCLESLQSNKVQKHVNKSYNWVARRMYGDTFEVDDNFDTMKVQLEHNVCSCGQWQKTDIPCGHATTSLRSRMSEAIHEMVDYKLTATVYRVAFRSETVNPITSHVHW
uniref:SWIM-type domain-containing protein n=1 Tax=Lactuca sativa TaxID=4236 RepID=A0A9R1X3T8_LACSA|nr:hypothetical protein LSAT_V11C700366890 [Lactuca sativa]